MRKLFFFATLIFLSTVIFAKSMIDNASTFRNDLLETRTLNKNQIEMPVSNNGILGMTNQFTGSENQQGSMPIDSDFRYLYTSSLWFGGYLKVGSDNDQWDEFTPQQQNYLGSKGEFMGPLVSTSMEGWTGIGGQQREMWATEYYHSYDNGDFIEKSNLVDAIDPNGNSVYDENCPYNQFLYTKFTDKLIDESYTNKCDIDKRRHIPLGVEVEQKTYVVNNEELDNVLIYEYTFTNKNKDKMDIYNFFASIYTDPDIGKKVETQNENSFICGDDYSFFVPEAIYRDENGHIQTAEVNTLLCIDNDGRDYLNESEEPVAGSPLNGATNGYALTLLTELEEDQKLSFNYYQADSDDEYRDWGPRWKDGLHDDWKYDLSYRQLGYDDDDQDSFYHMGGRTEGRPLGDKGRYMVMSNGEIDYPQYECVNVNEGAYSPLNPIEEEQKDKWLQNKNEDQETIEIFKRIQKGGDIKALLSVGPFGKKVNVNFDTENSNISKEMYKFKYNSSIKLAFAVTMPRNIHTSEEQNPYEFNRDLLDMQNLVHTVRKAQEYYNNTEDNYTDINDENNTLVNEIELLSNYPNPFNPATSINYKLNNASDVKLSVFNVKGEMVWEASKMNQNAGKHTVKFDGSSFNSGVYFYTLTAGNQKLTKKMMLIK